MISTKLYDHYVPSRMEVIPPGVDLTAFSPAGADWPEPPILAKIGRFLKDPDKPMILTMARPDERKNLEKLVEVYGKSEQLQEHANLVMVMGARDDLRELPKGQQQVIRNVIYLIDKYDLYGKVAYPKHHLPNDIADLYRVAAKGRGVFINPALTEPFGLTLLEAGATGLPIVATNDGGPRDIIANCNNGLLVDPLDGEAIEKALLRVLTEPEQWEQWSRCRNRRHASALCVAGIMQIGTCGTRMIFSSTQRRLHWSSGIENVDLPEFDRLDHHRFGQHAHR